MICTEVKYRKLSSPGEKHTKWTYAIIFAASALVVILFNYDASMKKVLNVDKETSETLVGNVRQQDTSKGAGTTSKLLSFSTTANTKDKMTTEDEKFPEHIRDCVPFYSLIESAIATKTGKRNWPKTSMTLIGAYAYSDYSVVTHDADGSYGQTMYCRYFDADWKELHTPVESMVFPEFAVHCCRHPHAAYMGISERKSEEVTLLVPVLDRIADEPKYSLSVCLAPMYGNDRKWLLLVELIEHYKLQGVQHFYIYVKDIDNYTRVLVDDYERSGEIEVIYLRKEDDRFGSEWQLAGIEDCLQRSRHHSRYAIFTDLDERILALGDQTLAEYVQTAMTENPNLGTLTFQKAIVMRTKKPPAKYEGEQTLKNHLPTLVFHNTSAPIREGGKCVVDPRRVLLMWIHEAYLYFPGFEGATVPPNKALIRHYRINAGTRWLARMQNNKQLSRGNFTFTDYPENLMELLYTNVKKRLARVYPVKQSLLNLFKNAINDFIN